MTALVHAGASGVGTAAIQICERDRRPDRGDGVVGQSPGVPVISAPTWSIDYTTEDYAEKVMELTDGVGADVILDVIGGDYLAQATSRA